MSILECGVYINELNLKNIFEDPFSFYPNLYFNYTLIFYYFYFPSCYKLLFF